MQSKKTLRPFAASAPLRFAPSVSSVVELRFLVYAGKGCGLALAGASRASRRLRTCEIGERVDNFSKKMLPSAGICARKEMHARLTDLKYETEGRLDLETRRAG
jgi:hypothetical protein